MPQSERFETLVLGCGNGGMYLAWHMARSGRRTAVVAFGLTRVFGDLHGLVFGTPPVPNLATMPKDSACLLIGAERTETARRGDGAFDPQPTFTARHEFMKAVLEIAVHVLGTEQFRRIGLVVAEQERPRVFKMQRETAERFMLDADRALIDLAQRWIFGPLTMTTCCETRPAAAHADAPSRRRD